MRAWSFSQAVRGQRETLPTRGSRRLLCGQRKETSTTERVRYAELLPHEFEQRLRQRPVGYLPLGTLEWHGPHSPLGADFIQASAILERAARRFGGILLPPIWLGPDSVFMGDDGRPLIGMDWYSTPKEQLPGSLYWISEGLFRQVAEAILVQAKRAGFRCVVAEGHGPSRDAFGRLSKTWRRQYDLHLLSAGDFPGEWATQNDHAGRNETSVLMAVAAELVDITQLPATCASRSIGIIGENPRTSTAAYGEELIETTLRLIGAKLDELGV